MLAIVMAGPTASGKSAIALALARHLGAAIVNVDSMQVYRDLRILTARPGEADEASVEHHLYGFVEAKRAFSAGKWLTHAGSVLDDLKARRKPVILTGGTGLYFKALEGSLAPIPEIPEYIRGRLRARSAELGTPALFAQLKGLDRETARRIEPSDTQRIVRALEVIEATGMGLSQWQSISGGSLLARWRIVRCVLKLDRAELYRACDLRLDRMMERGAMDEVRLLAAMSLDGDLPIMKALGVPQLLDVLGGKLGLDEACGLIKRDTRRYAKRQMTWFRNQMDGWPVFAPDEAVDRLLAFV